MFYDNQTKKIKCKITFAKIFLSPYWSKFTMSKPVFTTIYAGRDSC